MDKYVPGLTKCMDNCEPETITVLSVKSMNRYVPGKGGFRILDRGG